MHSANKITGVSVVILTKNEEATIGHTLAQLSAFDDVIVTDSNSTDATVAIVEAAGARAINFTWNGQFPKKKQWSLAETPTKYDWVLLLDADEYPSPEMVEEIRALRPVLESGQYAAFDMYLSYRFEGKFLRHGHRVTKRSLLHKSRAYFPEVDDLGLPGIPELEMHYQPQADGDIGRLKSRLCHDDRDPLTTWFARHNNYSDWEAHLLMRPEARQDIASKRSAQGKVWNSVPLKSAVFFAYSYVARGGFLDGRPGFDYAMGLSMYYWQIGAKYRELRRLDSAHAMTGGRD